MIKIQKFTPILTVILLTLAINGFSHSANASVFNAKSTTLDNGLQVVVIENPRVPVVTHMVWYRVGAADELPGKSGKAHFLEHLMFKGSGDLEPGEFSKTIKSLGGRDNAFTAQDYTAFFQSVASEHLETVMRMEAGRMRNLHPPLDEVESERLVVREERRQRTDNNPSAQFSETLAAALFVNHPYGAPVIGWDHEIEDLNWSDTKSFYDEYYAPNNAILVVSGAVKTKNVFDLAKKIYGGLEKRPIPERKRTTIPPLPGRYDLSFEHRTIQQPSFQRRYRAPSSRQNKKEALALQVLQDIFGAGSTSRLYTSLVIDQKIASSAGMSYQSDVWDDGSIWLYATPQPGITLEVIKNALDTEIQKLAQDGVTNDELQASLKRLQAEAIYARDSLQGPAMVIGTALITGSTLDDVETWPANISKISAKDIQDVAQKYLNIDSPDSHFVNGYLSPKEADATKATPAKNNQAQ